MLRKSGSLSIFCRLLVRTVVFGRVTYLVLAIVDFKVVWIFYSFLVPVFHHVFKHHIKHFFSFKYLSGSRRIEATWLLYYIMNIIYLCVVFSVPFIALSWKNTVFNISGNFIFELILQKPLYTCKSTMVSIFRPGKLFRPC